MSIFLRAEWRDLLMVNYEVDPAILAPHIPRGTELDTFAGRTFVSMVGFRFLRTRVLGVPVPGHRDFDEVNLRFYVIRKAGRRCLKGVVFVKEIVPRPAIAWLARRLSGTVARSSTRWSTRPGACSAATTPPSSAAWLRSTARRLSRR
jgi:uncharacterized protein YqjF (DUF2071 family)